MIKKILSILLVMSMLLSMLPTAVLADSLEQEPENGYTDADKTDSLEQEPENGYTDVDKADSFYEAVMYCLENGILNGTGEGTFSPDVFLTRAMYVTVLGRIAGVDTSQYNTSEFKDVAVDAWYAPYVAWAVEKGITQGTSKDTFSPDKLITREQMATMTARYFKSCNISFKAEKLIRSGPRDIRAISSWALDSVLSLWYAGLFTGDGNGNFNPSSNATRAEVATYRMQISKNVKEIEEKGKPTPTPTPPPTPTRSLSYDSGDNGESPSSPP